MNSALEYTASPQRMVIERQKTRLGTRASTSIADRSSSIVSCIYWMRERAQRADSATTETVEVASRSSKAQIRA